MPVDTSLIIVGRNAVREALERNPASLERVCLQRDARGLNRIRKLASRAGVSVRVLPQDGLRNLAGKVPHQGVLALQAAFKYADYSEMLAAIAPNLDLVRTKRPRLLLLDGIEDPRNFGAAVRSAAAFGVNGVIVCSHHMAPVSTAMVKASSGTATRMPIARVERLADVIPELQGAWLLCVWYRGERRTVSLGRKLEMSHSLGSWERKQGFVSRYRTGL